MKNIKWLFFDLGSTLIDESVVYKSRCDFAIKTKSLDCNEFMSMIYEKAKTSGTPIKDVAKIYGITLPEWDNSLEKLYPQTITILKELSKKYKLGIIANQTMGTQQRINDWNIGEYFDVVIASAEVGCSKPDLRIFNLALEQAGCKPEETVMIGDRLDNDIIPAKQIGMKTVWVVQGFAKFKSIDNEIEQPDYTIESIGEIINIFN